jgi:cytochrome c553
MRARTKIFLHLHLVIAVMFPLACRANELKASYAAAVCAACHGVNGVSVAEHIPNLAGQKRAYLIAQLAALKDSSRKSEVMNPIAAQLSEADISSAAAHFSAQESAGGKINSAFLPNFAKTRVSFPANYKTAFTRYHSQNDPESDQVKHYYANDIAIRAARIGKPLPDGAAIFVETHGIKLDDNKKPIKDGDGFFVPDKLLGYSAMARGAGWGTNIPALLRNDDWNYAIFAADQKPRSNINLAECFACHKAVDNPPVGKSSYVFTLKHLAVTRNEK